MIVPDSVPSEKKHDPEVFPNDKMTNAFPTYLPPLTATYLTTIVSHNILVKLCSNR